MTHALPAPQQIKDDYVRSIVCVPIAHGNVPEKPGRELVSCAVRSECAGCNIASHGFLCHFADGTCLRCQYPSIGEGTQNE